MPYDVGDTWSPELEVRGENDELTDATVTFDRTSPSGQVDTPTVVHISLGLYRAPDVVDESGRWQGLWDVSGAVTGVEETVAFVRAIGDYMPAVEQIRLLISDLSDDPTFSDEELRNFLGMEGDAVKLAAATALDTLASNEAMVSKKLKTLDLQTDGPAVAASLRAHAVLLREQHYYALDDASTEFEVTTLLGTPQWRRPGAPELTDLL